MLPSPDVDLVVLLDANPFDSAMDAAVAFSF